MSRGIPWVVLAIVAWVAAIAAAAQAILVLESPAANTWFTVAAVAGGVWLIANVAVTGWAAQDARSDPTSLGWLPPFIDFLKWSITCLALPGVGIALAVVLLSVRARPDERDAEVRDQLLRSPFDPPKRSYEGRLSPPVRRLFACYMLTAGIATHIAAIALLVLY